jgi:hypothetical protein
MPYPQSGKESAGIIAQDVQPNYNYAISNFVRPVVPDDTGDYLRVNYVKFLPLLVNSLKVLSTQVKEISSRID